MSTTVALAGVSKWFGQKVALSDIDVEFGPGVTGLLGPNGAGKTTMLRIILGLQRPSSGTVRILGRDPREDVEVYRNIQMVPEDESVYSHLTAREFVRLNARLLGLPDERSLVDGALDAVDLSDVADRNLDGFSKGMRQRAKVAATLVTEPEVLVLDEPLNGADPVQRAHLIDLFVRLGETRTVIVSSHVLSEVERMASRIVAIVDGRMAAVGTVAEVRSAMTDRPRIVRVSCDEPRRLAAALIHRGLAEGVDIAGDSVELRTADAGLLAQQLAALVIEEGIVLRRVEPSDESLESVFRYLVDQR